MTKKGNFEYTRVIKLPPSLGDWTNIRFQDSEDISINISPIVNVNFDSLPKQILNQAHYLHYQLAEHIVQKLSVDLNIKVELHTISATQISYEDFLNTQIEKVVQSDFTINTIGSIKVIFEWGLADMIVNRLTGGKGEESESDIFSDIETDLLDIQINEFIPFFSQIWDSVFDESQVSSLFQCGPYKRDHRISLREAYILFNLYLGFGKGKVKKIILAYPNSVIKKLLTLKKQIKRPIQKQLFLKPKHLKKTSLNVTAILGKTILTMNELKHLQKGDIIPLDELLSSPISLKIENKTHLFAQPGIVNNKLCAQIIFINGEKDVILSQKVQRKLSSSSEASSLSKNVEVVSLPSSEEIIHTALSKTESKTESKTQDLPSSNQDTFDSENKAESLEEDEELNLDLEDEDEKKDEKDKGFNLDLEDEDEDLENENEDLEGKDEDLEDENDDLDNEDEEDDDLDDEDEEDDDLDDEDEEDDYLDDEDEEDDYLDDEDEEDDYLDDEDEEDDDLDDEDEEDDDLDDEDEEDDDLGDEDEEDDDLDDKDEKDDNLDDKDNKDKENLVSNKNPNKNSPKQNQIDAVPKPPILEKKVSEEEQSLFNTDAIASSEDDEFSWNDLE